MFCIGGWGFGSTRFDFSFMKTFRVWLTLVCALCSLGWAVGSEPDVLTHGIAIRTATPGMRMPEPSSRLTRSVPCGQRYDRSAEGIVSPGIVDESAICNDQPRGSEQSRLNLQAAAIGKPFSGRIHAPMVAQQHGPRNTMAGCGAKRSI